MEGLNTGKDYDLFEKIKSSLKYLKINKLDGKISKFFESNYNYFFSQEETPFIKYVQEDGFIVCCNDSTFKLKLTPSYAYPDKICIELYNLNDNFIQGYLIEYLDSSANMVRITERKHYNINIDDNQKIKKRITSTIYLNCNKYFEKKTEVRMDKNDVCSQEISTWYPKLDDSYVKSFVSLGESFNQGSKIIYEKGDMNSSTQITEKEFKNIIYGNGSNSLLKKYEKCHNK